MCRQSLSARLGFGLPRQIERITSRFSCTPVLRTARAPLDDRSSGRAVRDLVLNKSGAVEERALPLKRGSAVRYLTGSAESADRCRQHVLRGAVKVRGVTDESAESCSGTPPALPDRGVKTTFGFFYRSVEFCAVLARTLGTSDGHEIRPTDPAPPHPERSSSRTRAKDSQSSALRRTLDVLARRSRHCPRAGPSVTPRLLANPREPSIKPNSYLWLVGRYRTQFGGPFFSWQRSEFRCSLASKVLAWTLL